MTPPTARRALLAAGAVLLVAAAALSVWAWRSADRPVVETSGRGSLRSCGLSPGRTSCDPDYNELVIGSAVACAALALVLWTLALVGRVRATRDRPS